MSELIFVEQEPMAGREHVPQPGATLGREGCDITLSDPEISRRHAAIRDVDGELAIEDLGSTNGTIVNGKRITGITRLSEGDSVQLGNTRLRVEQPAGATQAAGSTPSAPQVTAAREIPAEPPATEQQPVPEAKPPAPPPPQPAEAAGAAGDGDRRGDVPRPDFAPSAIRRVVPPPGGPAPFSPAGSGRPGGGSAATRAGATIYAYTVVGLTLAGVLVYYVTKPFE